MAVSADAKGTRFLRMPDWADELPAEWSWHRLDDLCLDIVDCPHSTPEIVGDGPYLMARTSDILTGVFRAHEARRVSEATFRERVRRAEPRFGDLLYSREGTYFGLSAEVPPDTRVCLGQRMVLLRPDPRQVDPTYLRCWLNSSRVQAYVHGQRDGSVAERLNLPTVRQLAVCVPPLPKQRAIAHILGTLDGKIELNRRTNETLEAIARALFKSWFVDFDPVRAKSEGRDPGLPPQLGDLFPDAFVDSEVGEIPKGWGADSAYRIARVLYGAPFKSDLFNDRGEGRPLVRIRDLGTHDPEVFTPEEHPRGYLVQPGDLVVGMDGEFRAHLWRGPQAWLNQRLCCFKPAATVPRAFVHYSIESLLDFFERSKAGTTVIHLGKADIDTFRVLIPSDPVLRAFASLVGPLDSRVVATAQESRLLTALRDTLLPRVMSGELSAASIGRSAVEASA